MPGMFLSELPWRKRSNGSNRRILQLRNWATLGVSTVNDSQQMCLKLKKYLVVFQNVRPDAEVLSRVSKLLETVGLSPRAVSCSTSLLPSPLISLRSGIARPLRTTCVDLTGLKNGRIKSSARGSKYCATLQEAGCILPGMEVVIADVMNQGQCGVGRLGEVKII